jgi:hypothetical protein
MVLTMKRKTMRGTTSVLARTKQSRKTRKIRQNILLFVGVGISRSQYEYHTIKVEETE